MIKNFQDNFNIIIMIKIKLKNLNKIMDTEINRQSSIDSDEGGEEKTDTNANPITVVYDENFTEVRSIVFFKAIFELFATFLFIFLIILCKKDISKFILGMWIILIVFGNFSGAHLNPAISLGFYINKGKYSSGLFKFLMYIIAQFLGCYLGILISWLMTGKTTYLEIPSERNILQVIFSEMFFTGTLFFIIIVVSFPQTTPSSKGYVNALFVVCWFFVIVNAGAMISGAAFNPAVLFCMNSVAYFAGEAEAKRDFSKLISMILAQFAGVIIFAYIYKNLILKFQSKEELKNRLGGDLSSNLKEAKNNNNNTNDAVSNNTKKFIPRFSHNVVNELNLNITELQNKY